MGDTFKPIKLGTVTDALIAATERADEMQHVLVIYEGKGDDPGGIVCDEGLDVKTANYVCDQLKAWLFRHIREFE